MRNGEAGKSKAAVVLDGYKPVTGTSIAQRIAHLLHEVRRVAPGYVVPYAVLARTVLGLARTPLRDSDKTDMVRSAIPRARSMAIGLYQLSIHVEPGIGARMTTDDDDAVKTRVHATAARVVSAHRALAAESGLVDATKVRDETERAWFKRDVVPTVKLLDAESRLIKLLPPKAEG